MKHESLSPPPASHAPDPRETAEPRWTTRKMTEFLRALAATHSVKDAASSLAIPRGAPCARTTGIAAHLTPGRRGAMVSATFGTFRASRPARNPREGVILAVFQRPSAPAPLPPAAPIAIGSRDSGPQRKAPR